MKHDITLEKLDNNDETSVLIEYTHAAGDAVTAGEPLLSCETAKAITEVCNERDGYVFYHYEEGSEVPFGSVILSVFDDKADCLAFAAAPKASDSAAPMPAGHGTPAQATRKARELAQSLGIPLESIPGKGLIKEADVRAFAAEKTDRGAPAAKAPSPVTAQPFKYDHERVAIIGAGKGAEVLIDILLEDHDKTVVMLVDDKVRAFSAFGRDYPVSSHGIYEFADLADRGAYDTAIISISANLRSMQFRGRIFDYYRQRHIPFANVIAKSADIRRGVQMGQGNIIGANSYIGAQTVIGDNNLISYCAVVGHHNVIGSTNLLAPAMATSGSVKIGSNCIIPAGVNFINGVSVGSDVIFPVGYNVSVDIADNSHIKDRR